MLKGRVPGAGESIKETFRYPADSLDWESTRLSTCQKSINSIIENLDEADIAGLVSFAGDVKTEIPLAERDIDRMSAGVDGMYTRGKTAFFSAVETACRQVKSHAPTGEIAARWLIVLTDGKDTSSNPGDASKATETFRREAVNLALITLGDDYEKATVEQWEKAIKERDPAGFIHVKADPNNMAAIKQAFDDVFEQINAASISGAS